MNNFAVILSGCGSLDGSDVWEVILLSYYLSRKGKNPVFFAPDAEQKEVVDHVTQATTEETRNVLKESARIAWGEIKEIKILSGRDVDGLILVGGDGVIKNLADFLGEPENGYLKPKPEIQRVIREIYRRRKPIGACGLASLLVASALRDILETPLALTIGKDPELIKQIEEMGAVHVLFRGTEVVMDSEHRVVSTPANLLKLKPVELASSIENLINGVLEFTLSKTS
ncbi:MAG: isoprenoid biosynthesis glyoxalase ElbB [candidate division Zixibacteria bacterium]|nr:isoprenoid biosynthesis glyoxalase ElbB [candidate division Zixibacteria bacterium]